MLWVFILPPREGLFAINFMPFYPGAFNGFCCHEKQFPGGVPGSTRGLKLAKKLCCALFFQPTSQCLDI